MNKIKSKNKKVFFGILIFIIVFVLSTIFSLSQLKKNDFNHTHYSIVENVISSNNNYYFDNKNEEIYTTYSEPVNSVYNNSTQTKKLGERANTKNFYINDKPVNLNNILSSKFSLGFLLNYHIDVDLPISKYEIDIDTYINNFRPKGTGMWITNGGLQGLENSKSSREKVLDLLESFGLEYKIDKNGFLEKNASTIDISEDINSIIDSDKLVIVGFSPIYYIYLDNMDDKVNSIDLEKTFVSFEPIDNIYTYIIKEGCDFDEFEEIVKQILIDIK